ncbi:UNVERIFIED_CONTAM: hypothetical protein K2H54_052958 [Gekko kuhli]
MTFTIDKDIGPRGVEMMLTVRASMSKGLRSLKWKGSRWQNDVETLKVKFKSMTMTDSEVNHSEIMEMLKEFEIELKEKPTISPLSGIRF